MAIVAAVTTFADEPSAWLDYLARRTRWTLGARCAAARVVAIGRFEAATDTLADAEVIIDRPKPRPQPETESAAEPTATPNAGPETALTGPEAASKAGPTSKAGPIELDLPRPVGTAAPTRFPLPSDGDRTLAFLAERAGTGRRPPLDAVGALVPQWSTPSLDADAEVARWYAGLPTAPPARALALAEAARRDGAAEQPSAIRAIADERLEQAALALLETSTAAPNVAILAAVSLWLLGRRPESIEAFNAVVRRTGAVDFRARWQVAPSDGDPSTLFGPDPDGWGSS